MITFPLPSWRTTRAMAVFRRPVPIIVWAAKPPGSLDFTYFVRSSVSKFSSVETDADTTREETLAKCETEMDFERGRERLFGLCDTLEENEREATEDAREAIETAIL